MTEKQINHIKSIIKNKKIKTFGVEIPLTPEQLKEFEKMVEPKYRNPYERVEKGDYYYTIDTLPTGEFVVIEQKEEGIPFDNVCFVNGNYYNNREFANQIAMKLNLQRKLRKFTYDNGWSEEMWEDRDAYKYYISFRFETWDKGEEFLAFDTKDYKEQNVYFISYEIADRAICEIIRPFMKENPTFKW